MAPWKDIGLSWEMELIAAAFHDSKGRSVQLRLSWEVVINVKRW